MWAAENPPTTSCLCEPWQWHSYTGCSHQQHSPSAVTFQSTVLYWGDPSSFMPQGLCTCYSLLRWLLVMAGASLIIHGRGSNATYSKRPSLMTPGEEASDLCCHSWRGLYLGSLDNFELAWTSQKEQWIFTSLILTFSYSITLLGYANKNLCVFNPMKQTITPLYECTLIAVYRKTGKKGCGKIKFQLSEFN